MKKLLIITVSLCSLFLGGCLKDTPNVDFSSTGTIVEFEYPAGGNGSGLGSGLEYFGGGTLTYPQTDIVDTATFMVNIASSSTLKSDLNITIGVDAAALGDHYSVDSLNFEKMPDSLYKIISTSALIKAGSRLATFKIAFYPSKIDPSHNYGLPITVANSGGYTISGNFGHIYFHTIGNPLAGPYKWDYTRYNSNTNTGTPTTASVGLSTTFLPDNPTAIEVQSGYYIGPHYVLTFSNNAGTLSNFAVSFNATDIATMVSGGVTITDGPHILIADPVNKVFQFQYIAYNGSGYRYIIDKYYK